MENIRQTGFERRIFQKMANRHSYHNKKVREVKNFSKNRHTDMWQPLIES